VAHKTGWIGEVVYHDAGVVYPADGASYVLVVLTGGIKEDSVAHNLVADLRGSSTWAASQEGYDTRRVLRRMKSIRMNCPGSSCS